MSHEHERRTDLSSEEVKQAMKQALKEWLDEKYATFGAISMNMLFALALGALAYFILRQNGWHKLP